MGIPHDYRTPHGWPLRFRRFQSSSNPPRPPKATNKCLFGLGVSRGPSCAMFGGSFGENPMKIHENLPQLKRILLRKSLQRSCTCFFHSKPLNSHPDLRTTPTPHDNRTPLNLLGMQPNLNGHSLDSRSGFATALVALLHASSGQNASQTLISVKMLAALLDPSSDRSRRRKSNVANLLAALLDLIEVVAESQTL